MRQEEWHSSLQVRSCILIIYIFVIVISCFDLLMLSYSHGRYGHVSEHSRYHHSVLSGDGSSIYDVVSQEEGSEEDYKCSCKAFSFHKNACKHIVAVQIRKGTVKEASIIDYNGVEDSKVLLIFTTVMFNVSSYSYNIFNFNSERRCYSRPS